MYKTIPSKYRSCKMSQMPDKIPPPRAESGIGEIGEWVKVCEECSASLVLLAFCNQRKHCTANSNSSADKTVKTTTPNFTTSIATIAGPNNAPALPPAAMKPNKRRPCSLLKWSAITLQKILTTKRLNTLSHTKKTRAT